MKKRATAILTALVLALVLILSLLPISALGIVDENSGTWGDNVIWALTENEDELEDGTKGLTLTFTGRGKMMDCESKPSATPWAGNWDITRVVINAGITNVPDFLCGNDWGGTLIELKSISIPATAEEIGACAFAGNKLTEIHIPGNVKTIASSAFNACDSLSAITVEASNRNYQAVDGVLYSKGENAELIKYPAQKIDMSYTIPDGIKKIPQYALMNNQFLQTVILPNSIKEIGRNAFDGCENLQTIVLPDSLTEIGSYAFSGCALDSANWPATVQRISDGMFIGCDFMEITIPEGVKEIGCAAFMFCNKLKQIKLPNSITTVDPTAFWTYSEPEEILDVTIPASVVSFTPGAGEADAMLVQEHNDVIFRFQGNAPNNFDLDSYYTYYDGHKACTTIYYPDGATGWEKVKNSQDWGAHVTFVVDTATCRHTYEWKMVTGATCTEGGTQEQVCTKCGTKGETRAVGKLPHVYEWKVTKTATCTQTGTEDQVCTKCGGTGESRETDFAAHNFDEGVCTVCGSKQLVKAMFTVDTTAETYTGKPITKNVYGVDGDTTLVEGADYTVAYKNNTRAGTATITITGMGDYTGTLTYSFTIKAKPSSGSGGSGGGSSSSGGSSSGGGGSSGGGSSTATKPVETGKPTAPAFADVVKDSWYEAGVNFVVEKGLFQGVAPNQFAPNTNMTRAMLMTVLARLDGQDTASGETWYAKGMDWAKAQGISDGTLPDNSVTREQLVTMLYRYARVRNTRGDLTNFADGVSVSGWAKDAMTWAVSQGILTGKDGQRLDPQGTATRAEVATILQRFVEKS